MDVYELVISFCTGSLKLDEGVDCVLEFFNHTIPVQ